MIKRSLRILLAILSVLVGLYPLIYLFVDRKFGLLQSKSGALLANTVWNIGFYAHILLGGLALLIGWIQFSTKLRNKNPALHRRIGKIYVLAVFISSTAGVYIGFFATGGIIPSLGFICLGIIWFSTTLAAYTSIRNGQVEKHQRLMIYSYAACFAAVTLRIWLPLLGMLFGNFITAYTIVAWLCWVPNLLIAYLIAKRIRIQAAGKLV